MSFRLPVEAYPPRDDDDTVSKVYSLVKNRDDLSRPDLGAFAPYVPFDRLPSRAPAQHRTGTRIDPMFSHLWDGPTTASWVQRSDVVRAVRQGYAKAQGRLADMVTPLDPVTMWTGAGMACEQRKRLLAAALMWRTATTQQLGAMCDIDSLNRLRGDETTPLIRGLVGSDLLNVGSLARTIHPAPPLLRPTSMPKWISQSAQLPFADWLSITAGRRVVRGSQFSRHNILTNEVSLRVAEFTNMFAVLGELCGRVDELSPVVSRQVADAVWIRPDGFKIAVEMTSHANADLEDKIEAWANTLAADATRGMAVVFIAARRSTSSPPIVPRLSNAIARSAVANTERLRARVGNRMLWVDWHDWFGEGGLVSTQFPTLPVFGLKREVTTANVPDRWRVLHLGDTARTPWQPADQDAAEQVAQHMVSTQLLRGQPFWMRDEATVQEVRARLDVWMLRRIGGLQEPILAGYQRPDKYEDQQSPRQHDLARAAWNPPPLKLPTVVWPPQG